MTNPTEEKDFMEEITLKNCMKFAVATEEAGAKFYNQLAENFSDNKEIHDLFTQLSKDEVVHQKQFSNLLDKVGEDVKVGKGESGYDFIKAMSVSDYFDTEQGPFKDVDKVKDREEALSHAFELEKATLGFYNAVKAVLGDNDTLNSVIQAEQNHITTIMKVMVTEGKFRSLEDKW
ncbi:MAG: hypothetical protein GF307_05275 [candidate division Zixibacteria bacterium]|nr:hypothetical protein [candidate division Zixibacteria bacterium]